MKLGFEESQTLYSSGSQSARAWTERWVKDWIYCPNCGNPHVDQFPANRPVADFFCSSCAEEFELKSQKTAFGAKVLDGAFRTMTERLASSNNPNLLLLNYDLAKLSVTNTFIVRKHFSCKKSSKKENRLRQQRGVRDGPAAISCSVKFPRREKYISSATVHLSRKTMSCPNGNEPCSYGKRTPRREVG